MIGGAAPTAAARATARELLGDFQSNWTTDPVMKTSKGESEAISKGESESRHKRAK
jgi:hypothetical protein